MGFVKEDVASTLAELQQKHNESKIRQVRIKQYVGQQMSELVNEPRWTTYNQHLNALKERHSTEYGQIERKLNSTAYIEPNEFIKLRTEYIKHKTAFEAFEQAQILVRHLIDEGKNAEEALNNQ